MITWNEFKSAIEREFERLDITGEVKLRYIDSGGYVPANDLFVDINERDEAGKPTEVSIWS